MIEIIPNWHPIFVHFSIALLSTSALFHILVVVKRASSISAQFETVANWNLWVGAIFSLATVTAGWFAYNSVSHDTPSHLAMTDHRNWGIATSVIFVLLGLWSFKRFRKSIAINWTLTIPVLIASTILLTTGWKGGELVYRHGLGVMSLPETDAHDHGAHDHGSQGNGSQGNGSQEHGDHQHGELEQGEKQRESEGQINLGEESEHEVGEHAHEGHAHEGDGEIKQDSADGQSGVMNEPAVSGSDSAQADKKSTHSHDDAHDHGDHPH